MRNIENAFLYVQKKSVHLFGKVTMGELDVIMNRKTQPGNISLDKTTSGDFLFYSEEDDKEIENLDKFQFKNQLALSKYTFLQDENNDYIANKRTPIKIKEAESPNYSYQFSIAYLDIPQLMLRLEDINELKSRLWNWIKLGSHLHILQGKEIECEESDFQAPILICENIPSHFCSLKRFIQMNSENWGAMKKKNTLLVLNILFQISIAAGYLHQRGLVHNSLNTDSILFYEDEELIKLGNPFLLSKIHPITKGKFTGAFPMYWSPEQALGFGCFLDPDLADMTIKDVIQHCPPIDFKSDIYCLGLIMLELLNGTTKWERGDKIPKVVYQQTIDFIPKHFLPGLTILVDLAFKCLERDPSRRPNGMTFISEELLKIFSSIFPTHEKLWQPLVEMDPLDISNYKLVSIYKNYGQEKALNFAKAQLKFSPKILNNIYFVFNFLILKLNAHENESSFLLRAFHNSPENWDKNRLEKMLYGRIGYPERIHEKELLPINYDSEIFNRMKTIKKKFKKLDYQLFDFAKRNKIIRTPEIHLVTRGKVKQVYFSKGGNDGSQIIVYCSYFKLPIISIWTLKNFRNYKNLVVQLPSTQEIRKSHMRPKSANKSNHPSGYFESSLGVNYCSLSPNHNLICVAIGKNIFEYQIEKEAAELKFTLCGHAGTVSCLCISDDSTICVSGGMDKSIKVWNLKFGNEVLSLTGHEERISYLKFLQKDQIIISGSYDATIRLWKYPVQEKTYIYNYSEKEINMFRFAPGLGTLVAVIKSNYLEALMFDKMPPVSLFKFQAHESSITDIQLYTPTSLCITSAISGAVKVWNLKNGLLLSVLGLFSPIKSIFIYEEVEMVMFIDSDLHLHEYPLTILPKTNQKKIQQATPQQPKMERKINDSEDAFLGDVKIDEMGHKSKGKKNKTTLHDLIEPIEYKKPESKMTISQQEDINRAILKIGNLYEKYKSGNNSLVLMKEICEELDCIHSSFHLLSSSYLHKFHKEIYQLLTKSSFSIEDIKPIDLFPIATFKLKYEGAHHMHSCLALNPKSTLMAVGYDQGKISLYAVFSLKFIKELVVPKKCGTVKFITFLDEDHLAECTDDNSIRIWDISETSIIGYFKRKRMKAKKIKYSKILNLLFSFGHSPLVTVISLTTMKIITQIPYSFHCASPLWITALEISPSGNFLYIGATDHKIKIFEIIQQVNPPSPTSKSLVNYSFLLRGIVQGHTDFISQISLIAFSSQGEMHKETHQVNATISSITHINDSSIPNCLISSSYDATIIIIRKSNSQRLQLLKKNQKNKGIVSFDVNTIFNPDFPILLLVTTDNQIELWIIKSTQRISHFYCRIPIIDAKWIYTSNDIIAMYTSCIKILRIIYNFSAIYSSDSFKLIPQTAVQ